MVWYLFQTVKLSKDLSGDDLEKILIKAAEELGLRAVSKDEFGDRCTLGDKLERDYYGTVIKLKRSIFPVGSIIFDKIYNKNTFYISTGVSTLEFGSRKLIEKYLRKVMELAA